jgi:hypothetical protein
MNTFTSLLLGRHFFFRPDFSKLPNLMEEGNSPDEQKAVQGEQGAHWAT